jgi:hypothetical protein
VPTSARSPRAQALRALVLALVASGGATVAHAVGGGHLVSGSGVLVATALLTGATLPFVRSGLTDVRSAVLLAALQVAAHVVHGLAAMAAGSPVHGTGTGPSHAAHGIRPLGRIDTGVGTGAGTADPGGVVATSALTDLLPTPTMLLAHVAAAVTIGVLLTRSEESWRVACALLATVGVALTRAVLSLAHGAVALIHAVAATCAGLRDPRPRPSDGRVPADVWRARTPVRRGPPACLLT